MLKSIVLGTGESIQLEECFADSHHVTILARGGFRENRVRIAKPRSGAPMHVTLGKEDLPWP